MNKQPTAQLEAMMEKLKPKARYLSQMHVEEYTDSIYKEIINGDIQIPKESQQLGRKSEKEDWEDQLRKKILQKAENERKQLQHKLGYLSNSINSIKKHDELRAALRSPRSLRESYSMGASRVRQQQWREEIRKREEELAEKRKKVEELKKSKEQEALKQMQLKKQEELNERRNQILAHMKKIEERMKKRQESAKIENERYRQVKNGKSLHEKISESFDEKESSFLEERKKKLAQIRNLHKPIDEKELREHEEKFLELKRQKEEMRERERKMNDSRSQSYSSYYEGRFYKQIAEGSKNVEENYANIKHEKMKQFSDHVRDHYAPKISPEKREEIEQMIENEKNKEAARLERERELMERSKVKGAECLEFIRNLPKRKKPTGLSMANQTAKTDKISYKNYLTHRSVDNGSRDKFRDILKSSKDKESKAIQIQFASQRLEDELRRKQEKSRCMPGSKEQKDRIDEEYFKMIKAKLDLLQE